MHHLLRRASWAAIPTLCVLGSFAAFAHAGSMPEPPSFTLKDLDGKVVRLSDYKGRPVVVDFWATWCQPCRASLPHLNALHERYNEKGLVILGLSVDDSGPQRVKRFADHLGLHFRVAMADEKVLDEFGPIRSIPTTFFIDKKGQVVRRVVGYIDEETMESYALELFGTDGATARNR